jgi:hypothetical protein
MASKIYIILHQPLSNYILDRFGFNQDLHNNITYLNILPLINSKVSQSYSSSNYKKDNFINFTSTISLLKFLIRKKNNFFYLNTTGKNFFSILIEFFFNLQNGIKFELIQPSLPLGKIGHKYLKNLYSLPRLILAKKLKNKIVDILYNLIYKILCKDAEIIFVSNDKAYNKLNKKKLIFKINQLDYYNFNKSNHDNDKNIDQDYFCFIDQEQENSFENQIYFTRYIPNYLDRISKLLKLIEKKTQLKAKIALHHRNKNIPIQYNSFDCIKDRSMDLIKNSKFVLTHNSTALNFAIMSKKPINLIWLNEFKVRLSKHATMKKLVEDLDCNMINEYQNLDNLNFEKQIDENKYEEFIKSYINFEEKILLEHPWKTIDRELAKL